MAVGIFRSQKAICVGIITREILLMVTFVYHHVFFSPILADDGNFKLPSKSGGICAENVTHQLAVLSVDGKLPVPKIDRDQLI